MDWTVFVICFTSVIVLLFIYLIVKENKNRQNEYKEHTDGMMLDFFNTYFENHINDMTEEEKELFNKIKDEKLKIKEKYKKVNE